MPSQSMATLAEQAAKLLDFSQKLDINLLDTVVGAMYSGEGPEVSSHRDMFNSTAGYHYKKCTLYLHRSVYFLNSSNCHLSFNLIFGF